jgi:hypothetical protein
MANWTDGLASRNADAQYRNNLATLGYDYMGKAHYDGIADEFVGNFSAGLDRLGSDMLGAVSYGLSLSDSDTAQWLRGKTENEANYYSNLAAYRSTIPDTADLSWGDKVTNPHYWAAQGGQFVGNVVPQVAMAMSTGGTTAGILNAGKIGGLLARAGVSEGLAGSVATGLSKVAKYGTELAVGSGLENVQNAGSIYNDYRNAGYGTDVAGDAFRQSMSEGWGPAMLDYAADRIGVSGKVGMLASAFAKDGGKLMVKGLLSNAANSAVEGYTEAWQQAIEGRIKGQEGYDQVSMLDPSTWTNDMNMAAQDAFNISMAVGGVGGAVRGASNKIINKADEMAGLTSTEDVIADSAGPIVQNDGLGDIVAEEPTFIDNTPLGNTEVDDISNASYSPMMEESSFANSVNQVLNKKAPEDYAAAMEAVQDERANIMGLHGDKTAEDLSPRMFAENFANLGFTNKEANLLSRSLYEDMTRSNEVVEEPSVQEQPQEETLAEKADRLGIELTEAERSNLERENPDQTSVRDITNRIQEREKQNAFQAQLDAINERRNAYHNERYENSPNKTYFEHEYKDNPIKARDAAYRVHNAMQARKRDANSSDIRRNEQAKNPRNYLAKAGIKSRNGYTNEELGRITNYVKHMDNTERTQDSAKSYIENRDVAEKMEEVINTLPPKDDANYLPAKHALASKIKDTLITLGANGIDVTGPQFDNVRKILTTNERRMLQANIDEAKRSAEETRRKNSQVAVRPNGTPEKVVNNTQLATSDRNIAGDDQMIADYLNSDRVTRDGLLKIQQYLSHTGRETGMKMPLTKEALKYRNANNDVLGGNIGPYNVIVPNPNKKWEARPVKKDHTETIEHDNPTGEEPIVTPYEERLGLNPAQPKPKKQTRPRGPRTVDMVTDDQKAVMRDVEKLAELKSQIQSGGQINEVDALKMVDDLQMETDKGKKEKQAFREYLKHQANEDTGDIDISDNIKDEQAVMEKHMDIINSIADAIQYLHSHPFISKSEYRKILNGIIAKRNQLMRKEPMYAPAWKGILNNVPDYKIPSQRELMEAVNRGEVKIPQVVLNAFLNSPSHFDENIRLWFDKDYNISDVTQASRYDRMRNFIILNALQKGLTRVKAIGMDKLMEELDNPNGDHLLGRLVNRAVHLYPAIGNENKYKSMAGRVGAKKLFPNGAPRLHNINSPLAKRVYSEIKDVVTEVMDDRISKNSKITEEKLKDKKTKNQVSTALRLSAYKDGVLHASIPNYQGDIYTTDIKMDIKLGEEFPVEIKVPEFIDPDDFKEVLDGYLYDMGVITMNDIIDSEIKDGKIIVNAEYVPSALFNNGSEVADYAFHALAEVARQNKGIVIDADLLDQNGKNYLKSHKDLTSRLGYEVIINDDTYTIVPTNDIQMSVTGDKKVSNSKNAKFHEPSEIEMGIMKKVADRSKGLGKLTNGEMRNILKSIMHVVNGDQQAYVTILNYIRTHPNLEIYVADRLVNNDPLGLKFNGAYMPSTGRLYITSDNITPTNDTFVHELLHSATDFTKTADLKNVVNDTLDLMREELEKDEGLAGEIYRAVGNGKILASVSENDPQSVEDVIQRASKNLKRAFGVVRKDGSNQSEDGTVSHQGKFGRKNLDALAGKSQQRTRIRQFIQSINNPESDTNSLKLIMGLAQANQNAHDFLDVPQAIINSPMDTKDKLFLAAMVVPKLGNNPQLDQKYYSFINEMFSYGNTNIFSEQQIREHFQDALADRKRVQKLDTLHQRNRATTTPEAPIAKVLAKIKQDTDYSIRKNDRIDQAEQKLLADIMENGGGIIERINPSEDGISFAWFRKMLQSPSSMARKLIPELKPIIKEAYVAARTYRRKKTEYVQLLDKQFADLDVKNGEDKKMNELLGEVDKRGREFAQPVAVNLNGELKYAIIKPEDTFTEFGLADDKRMRKFVKAEREKGNHVYIGVNKDVYQVISSKENIPSYKDKANANKVAMEMSKAYAKHLGYSERLWDKYVGIRQVLNQIHKDVNDNQVSRGKDPSADLWGYIPREHKRYGVYKMEVKYSPETGRYYPQYTVLTSFDTEADANKYVDSRPVEKGVGYMTIRRERYQADASKSYDGYYSNLTDEEAELHKVYERMSDEDAAALFNRVQGNYTETKKFIDHFLKGKDKSMTYDDFQNLINNKERMKELGLDYKKLQKEAGMANFEKLLKKDKDGVLTHDNVSAYLYRSSGAQMWNKHNLKRAGVLGHNEDHIKAIYHYANTQAKYQGNAPFLDFATRYYEQVYGENYEKQYGRNGTGAKNARQDIVHNYIQRVIGAPNNTDKVLNTIGREIPFIGAYMTKHMGDNWVTTLLNRNMQAMAVFKLGVFRPTAAIAQFGTLANVAALTGFTPQLKYAMQQAGKSGKNGKYGQLFDDLEVYEESASQASEFLDSGDYRRITIGGVKFGKLFDLSMKGFMKADAYTRKVAAIHAYEEYAAKHGLDTTDLHTKNPEAYKKAMEYAKDFVVKTNFDYTDIDSPQLFTKFGTLGKTILQFKKFGVKEAEFLFTAFKGPDGSIDYKGLSRFIGITMGMAGFMGLPFMSAGDDMLKWLTGKGLTDRTKDVLYDWAGKDQTKQRIAMMAIMGAPSMFGVDFSRNVGFGDLTPSSGSELLGPTLSTYGALGDVARNSHDWRDVVTGVSHALSPQLGNFYQAYTGNMRDWKNAENKGAYTSEERFMKLLGFRPVRESIENDLAYRLTMANQELKDGKKEAINDFLRDPSPENKQRIKDFGVTGKQLRDARELKQMSAIDKANKYLPKKSSVEADKVKEQANVYNTFVDGLYDGIEEE